MTANQILNYMSHYGLIFLGIIIFLEYLNLPGLPAGIILPLAGVWAAGVKTKLFWVLVISIGAGVGASCILYALGWYGGNAVLKYYMHKFPKQKEVIEKQISYLRSKGKAGVFITKLIPMVRTISSIPAGMLKINFGDHALYSTLGIAIWNSSLILTGYFLGQEVLNKWLA